VSRVVLNTFTWLAFTMGLVGLYAVTSYAVAQRTREIGIRMALGAEPRMVAWLILRRVLGYLTAGLSLGIVLTLVFHAMFSDTSGPDSPTDPALLAPLIAVVALVGVVSCAGPVRQAITLDPASTLRLE
jgi:ABC-type antimicrobial peptide transport system permease subunit